MKAEVHLDVSDNKAVIISQSNLRTVWKWSGPEVTTGCLSASDHVHTAHKIPWRWDTQFPAHTQHNSNYSFLYPLPFCQTTTWQPDRASCCQSRILPWHIRDRTQLLQGQTEDHVCVWGGGVYSPHILKLGTRQRLVVAAYRSQFPHEMPSAPTDRKLGGSHSPTGGLEKTPGLFHHRMPTPPSISQYIHQAHQLSHGQSHQTELLSHEYGALMKRRNVGSSGSKLGASQLG